MIALPGGFDSHNARKTTEDLGTVAGLAGQTGAPVYERELNKLREGT